MARTMAEIKKDSREKWNYEIKQIALILQFGTDIKFIDKDYDKHHFATSRTDVVYKKFNAAFYAMHGFFIYEYETKEALMLVWDERD